MDEEKLSKQSFVRAFGVLLTYTNLNVVSADLVDEETVVVTFKTGYKKEVNIACDSWATIIIDVIKAVM